MTISDEIYETGLKKAKHVVWVFSDLQQGIFENMKRCLDLSMDDYERLGKPAEAIWYLGDAVEGVDPNNITRMIAEQERAFETLNIPITYVNGNHDFDFVRTALEKGETPKLYIPFYDCVKTHKDWHASESVDMPCFTQQFHDFKLFCFQDHVAKDFKWLSTHGQVRMGKEYYPYNAEYFAGIRKEMAEYDGPIITIGHTAFPGGNRGYEIELLNMIQPLPSNVRLHLYGHSHIGEYKWPRERVFSQISWIDWQDIPQIDVASFENIRGCYCHSVILQIYEDNSLGVFFRNHDKHRFESAYFPARETAQKDGDYERFASNK